MSAEPSMEDILSSIKRIIAEEGDAQPGRPRRQARPAARPIEPPPAADDEDDAGDEVLELNDPMPAPAAPPPAPPPPAAAAAAAAAEPAAEPILSRETEAATRGSLAALSRLMVKPEPASDGTLEGLVREMLRPMLRDWLDANLPGMVEAMVKREIAKITGTQG